LRAKPKGQQKLKNFEKTWQLLLQKKWPLTKVTNLVSAFVGFLFSPFILHNTLQFGHVRVLIRKKNCDKQFKQLARAKIDTSASVGFSTTANPSTVNAGFFNSQVCNFQDSRLNTMKRFEIFTEVQFKASSTVKDFFYSTKNLNKEQSCSKKKIVS
jgi:hypothetical protein